MSEKQIRSWLALASALAAGVSLAAVQAPGASAANLVECSGSNITTFSPGLRLTPQTVTLSYQESLSSCPVSSEPGLTATATASFPHTAGCLNLDLGTSGSKTFHWSTGETSTFEFTIVGTTLLGQVIVTDTGTITAGKFAGSAAVEVITNASLSLLDCLAAPGVETVSGATTLAIAL